jgi:hypothetical protein
MLSSTCLFSWSSISLHKAGFAAVPKIQILKQLHLKSFTEKQHWRLFLLCGVQNPPIETFPRKILVQHFFKTYFSKFDQSSVFGSSHRSYLEWQ